MKKLKFKEWQKLNRKIQKNIKNKQLKIYKEYKDKKYMELKLYEVGRFKNGMTIDQIRLEYKKIQNKV